MIKKDSANEIFRQDAEDSFLLSKYCVLKCSQFVRLVLSEPLRLICYHSERFVIDEKLIDNSFFLDSNIRNVEKLCSNIIFNLIKYLNNLPKEIFEIFSEIKSITESKFEGMGNKAVTSFFILRFISRAIIAPRDFDLIVIKEMNVNHLRVSTLISKILNQISTKTISEDEMMVPFHHFIENSISQMEKIIEMVSKKQKKDKSLRRSLGNNTKIHLHLLPSEHNLFPLLPKISSFLFHKCEELSTHLNLLIQSKPKFSISPSISSLFERLLEAHTQDNNLLSSFPIEPKRRKSFKKSKKGKNHVVVAQQELNEMRKYNISDGIHKKEKNENNNSIEKLNPLYRSDSEFSGSSTSTSPSKITLSKEELIKRNQEKWNKLLSHKNSLKNFIYQEKEEISIESKSEFDKEMNNRSQQKKKNLKKVFSSFIKRDKKNLSINEKNYAPITLNLSSVREMKNDSNELLYNRSHLSQNTSGEIPILKKTKDNPENLQKLSRKSRSLSSDTFGNEN